MLLVHYNRTALSAAGLAISASPGSKASLLYTLRKGMYLRINVLQGHGMDMVGTITAHVRPRQPIATNILQVFCPCSDARRHYTNSIAHCSLLATYVQQASLEYSKQQAMHLVLITALFWQHLAAAAGCASHRSLHLLAMRSL
jgi:hypothetical protein